MHRVLNLRVFITKSTQPKSGFSVLSEFEHRVVCWCKACVDCVEMGWGGREGGGGGGLGGSKSTCTFSRLLQRLTTDDISQRTVVSEMEGCGSFLSG